MKKSLLITLITIIAPGLTYAQSCRYQKEIDFTVDAASVQNLQIDVGAGDLSIRGNGNTSEVSVTAVACASSRNRLDGMDLLHRSQGTNIEIFTEIQRRRNFLSLLSFGSAYIDIEMVVPEGLALQVDDGSGSVDITGVSSLVLEDGSGSIAVSDVNGDVHIEDGSGAIDISRVDGLVSIDDGSGGLEVIESSAVRIIDDGSGGIRIANIARNVHIEDDGSGGIDIQEIGGDVTIDSAGSGSLNVQSVAGNYYFDRD